MTRLFARERRKNVRNRIPSKRSKNKTTKQQEDLIEVTSTHHIEQRWTMSWKNCETGIPLE